MTMDTMTEQNAPETWVEAADRFIDAAGDLSDLYAPQIMALRSYAQQLDAADDPPALALAEYSRVHRWLINKIGGTKSSPGGAADEEASILDMFRSNPGAVWRDN